MKLPIINLNNLFSEKDDKTERKLDSEFLTDKKDTLKAVGLDGYSVISMSEYNCDLLALNKAINDPEAFKAYDKIRALTFSTEMIIESEDYSEKLRTKILLDTYFTKETQEAIFDELAIGTARGLLFCNPMERRSEIVTYFNRITQKENQLINNINNKGEVINYIYTKDFYNIKKEIINKEDCFNFSFNPYKAESSLVRALPFIDAKYLDTETQKKSAKGLRLPHHILSPDYGSVANNNLNFNKFYNKVGLLAKELKSALVGQSRVLLTEVPLKAEIISQNPKDFQLMEWLGYCDNQINASFGVIQTLSKPSGGHRPTIEDDRDNTEKLDIQKYHDKLIECANWLVKKVYPGSKVKIYYKTTETQETLKLRQQALQLLNSGIPAIKAQGYNISKKSVNKLLNVFDLSLEEYETNFNPKEEQTYNFIDSIVNNRELIPNSNLDEDLSLYEEIAYLEDTRAYNDTQKASIYKSYRSSVNMSYSELLTWSDNPCSKLASQGMGPINRNLELLSTLKQDWTEKHYRWANMTISFIARMSNVENSNPITTKDGKTCPSKRDISLMNWAFNRSKPKRSLEIEYKEITIIPKDNQVTIRAEKPKKATDYPPLPSFNVYQMFSKRVYKDIKAKTIKSVKEQYKKVETNIKNRAYGQYINPFNNQADFEDYLADTARLGIDELAKHYDDEIDNDSINQLISDLYNLTFQYINLKENDKKYSGFYTTQNTQIDNWLRKNPNYTEKELKKQISQWQQDDIQRLEEGFFKNIFLSTIALISLQNGRTFVGAESVRDDRVRPDHVENDGTMWENGKLPPSGGSIAPWGEFGCRCSYTFGMYNDLILRFRYLSV